MGCAVIERDIDGLKETVFQGEPAKGWQQLMKHQIPGSLKPFYQVAAELSIYNGLLMRGK